MRSRPEKKNQPPGPAEQRVLPMESPRRTSDERLRRASVIAALFLLASAAMVHAECAWVMWKSTIGLSSSAAPGATAMERMYTTWEPKASYATLAACEKALPGDETKSGKHVCLPDTVDPRGPKGK